MKQIKKTYLLTTTDALLASVVVVVGGGGDLKGSGCNESVSDVWIQTPL
jgi:hypothetical protein